MKKALLGFVLAAGSIFAGPRVAIGFSLGGPPPVAYVRPAYPGPGFVWVDGYYNRGLWTPGYWRAPIRVVAPVVRYRDYDRGYYRDYRHDRDDRRFEHGYRR